MGRPSKLTEKQWSEILRRHIAGEKMRPFAREFGVSEATVRERVSPQCAEIKSVAEQLVASDVALKELPVSAQILALNLADDLRAISTHLASAAKYGSMTAHRLASIAHSQTSQLDDAATLEENMPTLKAVAAFTATANEAAKTGLNLLAANKGREFDDGDKGVVEITDARNRNLGLIEQVARRASGGTGA